MGYRDDFYTRENIIGYTGDINSPDQITVYFRHGNTFGRITQQHDNPDNVGRNKIRNYDDYRIYNNVGGQGVEFYNGSIQHTSRNAFVAVAANDQRINILAQAIANKQQVKPKYN